MGKEENNIEDHKLLTIYLLYSCINSMNEWMDGRERSYMCMPEDWRKAESEEIERGCRCCKVGGERSRV